MLNCTKIVFSFILICLSIVILGITSACRSGNSSFLWRLRFADSNNKRAFKVRMQCQLSSNIPHIKNADLREVFKPDLNIPKLDLDIECAHIEGPSLSWR